MAKVNENRWHKRNIYNTHILHCLKYIIKIFIYLLDILTKGKLLLKKHSELRINIIINVCVLYL